MAIPSHQAGLSISKMVFLYLKQEKINHQWSGMWMIITEWTSLEETQFQSVEVSTTMVTNHTILPTTISTWHLKTWIIIIRPITQSMWETATRTSSISVNITLSMKTCFPRYRQTFEKMIKRNRHLKTYSNRRRALSISDTAMAEHHRNHQRNSTIRVCRSNIACQPKYTETTLERQRLCSHPIWEAKINRTSATLTCSTVLQFLRNPPIPACSLKLSTTLSMEDRNLQVRL